MNLLFTQEFEKQNLIKYDFFRSDDDKENAVNILKFIDEVSREFVNFFDTFFNEAKKILSIDNIKSVPDCFNEMSMIYQEIAIAFCIDNIRIHVVIGEEFIKVFDERKFSILLHHINGNHFEGFYKTYDEKRFTWIASMLQMINKEIVPSYFSQSSSYIPYIFRGITTSTSTLS